ncbi:hypothetical protein FRC17_003781 [Serendipita sp. 399]|nr:hypothetical protein FRC17_003781 [Serendipita sp. 399]
MQSAQNVSQGPTHTTAGTVSQVAWQFVVQYYTYMNDKPDQLHRFYTKNSHYLHGMEGEETDLLQGQTAIHKKFMEINFKSCKVFIHSVDAHPSANNGILVHVIGELSNNGEAWKKFVQVFFLAEQQNGYFVLNDNFRFLKEESFDDEEEEEQRDVDASIPVNIPAPVPQESYPHTNGYHHANDVTHSQQTSSTPTIAAPVPVPATSTPAPITPQETPLPPAPVETVAEIPRPPTPTPEHAPAVVPETLEPVVESAPTPPIEYALPKTPSPIPPSVPMPPEPVQPPVSTSVSHSPAVPTPSAPPAPKTWASLAAANPSRWGQNVAQEVKGVSAAAPHAPSNIQPPRDRPSTNTTAIPGPDPSLQQGAAGATKGPPQHPAYAAALAITTPLCFVKGVTENIPRQVFEQTLSARFGPIKECEIIRSKACAFLEFRSVESAKKAIIASLSPEAGGEGGIRFDEEKPARRTQMHAPFQN